MIGELFALHRENEKLRVEIDALRKELVSARSNEQFEESWNEANFEEITKLTKERDRLASRVKELDK